MPQPFQNAILILGAIQCAKLRLWCHIIYNRVAGVGLLDSNPSLPIEAQRLKWIRLPEALVFLELLQQVLVHDQHRSALNAGPHASRSDAAEPPLDPLRPVDHLQTGEE